MNSIIWVVVVITSVAFLWRITLAIENIERILKKLVEQKVKD